MLGLALIALAAAPDAGAAPNPLDLLQQQVAAWNRGDLDGFCSVYADDAVFVSPTGVTKGREQVLARYKKRYPGKKAMGTLTLTPLDVRNTSDETSIAAEWRIVRADGTEAKGHTVVVLQRWQGRWRIVHDASM